ncbi:alpha/beta fold hydrolase [Pedobacter sp. SYSU D00535]|uniref:alpha/beta fold hydrolase n=1 Tax=Pedobacter sp. SYSU D00535 TaxID=2810308 RepID=UPI001A961763|nr:alpha/beta hydrolase [Pedobacter sp. SYSU D00535]
MYTNRGALKLLAGAALMLAGRYLVSRLLSTERPIEAPKKWRPEEFTWLKCPGGNIVYVESEGQKNAQPLVFIHGLNANRYQWFYQRARFKKDFRLIYIDLPGHGRSPRPRDLSIKTLGEDLKYILDYLELQSPYIYGHSMGGMQALQYAADAKAAINAKGLIIHHTTFTNPVRTCAFSTILSPIQFPVLRPFLRLASNLELPFWILCVINYLNGTTSAFFRYIFFTGKQTSAQLQYMTELSVGVSPAVVAQSLLEMFKYDLSEKLKDVNVPVLIISAFNDRLTVPAASYIMQSKIKNAELRLLHQGHLSLIENPSGVNRVLASFLQPLSNPDLTASPDRP